MDSSPTFPLYFSLTLPIFVDISHLSYVHLNNTVVAASIWIHIIIEAREKLQYEGAQLLARAIKAGSPTPRAR